MSLTHILVFIIASAGISLFHSGKVRRVLLFSFSVLALYSLQPALALRAFDFWLPTSAIALSTWVWIGTQNQDKGVSGEDRNSLILLVFLIGFIIASSYLPKSLRLFSALPIDLLNGGSVVVALSIISWMIFKLRRGGVQFDLIFVCAIIVIFIILKTPTLTLDVAQTVRELTGQSPNLASVMDLNWLGFSYIAFRLMHVLRDFRSSRLPAMGFQTFLLYVLFFPAVSAGPIDRVERFIRDLEGDRVHDLWSQWQAGGTRIVRGLFLKFVIADSLAPIALNAYHVELVDSRLWLWLLLYLYSFQIFFDFNGYTEIAIGIGMLSGIRLPENFNRPYLQTDIGAFWNRWHVTLAQWFRSYVFNPLTRGLRRSVLSHSPWLIILIGQLATMILIGLWHGITWTFFVWGLWHALGLFLHNRWVEAQRIYAFERRGGKVLTGIRTLTSWFLTFQFVSLGWVWFSAPDIQSAWSTFLKLVGVSIG